MMGNLEQELIDDHNEDKAYQAMLESVHNSLANKVEEASISMFDKQHGGSHYSSMKIQPMEFALANNLNYGQANAIKYICRYENKNGLEDLKKAIHCIELLIEYKYGSL
jgi:hypothetical protein